ncbi:hypothetical protein [Acidithiobacillus acidisediminis]|uniref:hypothetical protein n=1 Tax=Acidithiobacillus acidisediminis TaxID=2937799 RepID=UPI00200C431D|nr:hypothetical protein [Acidithiobacillus sp. S30A2]
MKHLVISHGDKGGVGKSIFSMLAVEFGLFSGRNVAIVEGDTKIGDVKARYENVVSVLSVNLDKSGKDAENAIATLFGHLEALESDYVVMNAPANAHKALDSYAELIVPVARELGFQICVAWMIGRESSSATLANESAICQMADRKMAVVNRHESDYDLDYYWFTVPQFKDAWIASGGLTGEIPELASRVGAKIKEHQGRSFASLAGRESPLFIVERQIIKNWLRKSWEESMIPLVEEK